MVTSYLHGIGEVMVERCRWGRRDCEGTFIVPSAWGGAVVVKGTEGFGDGLVAEAYSEDVVSGFTMLDECEKTLRLRLEFPVPGDNRILS